LPETGGTAAYIHSHITSVQATSATTGASIGLGLAIGKLLRGRSTDAAVCTRSNPAARSAAVVAISVADRDAELGDRDPLALPTRYSL